MLWLWKSSGPGFKPRSMSAPAMTAAGDEPGTPSVTNGIIAAGAAALLAISDAVTPRRSPLPKRLLSLLQRTASLYETNAAMGCRHRAGFR